MFTSVVNYVIDPDIPFTMREVFLVGLVDGIIIAYILDIIYSITNYILQKTFSIFNK